VGPSAAARTDLGSCHLGKYPWEVTAWEKAFGKVQGAVPQNMTVYMLKTFCGIFRLKNLLQKYILFDINFTMTAI